MRYELILKCNFSLLKKGLDLFKRLQKYMWQSCHNQKPVLDQNKAYQFAHGLR